MYFLKCINCGFLNEVKSEYLVFCSRCNKKLENNYTEWKKENPKKTLEDYQRLVCVSNVEIQESSVKVKATNPNAKWYGIGAAFMFVIFLLIGQFGGEYITQIFNYEKTSQEVLEQEWIRQSYGEFGLSLETPVIMTERDLPIPDHVRQMIDVMDVYKYASEEGFQVIITSIQYNQSVGSMSLQGAANGSVAEMQKQPGLSDFDYSEKQVFKGDIPGYEQTGTYKIEGIKVEFINTGFTTGLIYWQVMVVFQAIDEVGRIAAKRVIESIEINTDSSLQ